MLFSFIKPENSQTPIKDVLIQAFEYARNKTLGVIKEMNCELLDFYLDDQSNSIGTLLKHIAALEYYYQRFLFDKRDLNMNEREFWRGALPGHLHKKNIRGNDISYYLDLLHEVRVDTLEYLSGKSDNWLFETSTMDKLPPTSNYSWLFHLIEEEFNHLGQIKLTIARNKLV